MEKYKKKSRVFVRKSKIWWKKAKIELSKRKQSILPLLLLALSIAILLTSVIYQRWKSDVSKEDLEKIRNTVHCSGASSPFFDSRLVLSQEVLWALNNRTPIVALESTIITHGMEYPENIDTAMEVEDIVRSFNVTPATIVIINGTVHVGLNKLLFDYIGENTQDFVKCSRRDIPYILARNESCGTTVAATMIISKSVGIEVFVTGGIGGVHRNVADSWDISADLDELGRTSVLVVSAGVKSILDIPKTLEYLETKGVPVVGYKSLEFPAFFSRNSGEKVVMMVENAREMANMLHVHVMSRMETGMMLAVPIPEGHEFISYEKSNLIINSALDEARELGVRGKDITPFILQRIYELSDGKSLKSNIVLIKNNARVGAAVAREYWNIQNNVHSNVSVDENVTKATEIEKDIDITVIGSASVDLTAKPRGELGQDVPGTFSISFGGVARNVLEALQLLGDVQSPHIITSVGSDEFGKLVLKNIRNELNTATNGIKKSHEFHTGIFHQILNENGILVNGVAAMDIFEAEITPEFISEKAEILKRSKYIFMDASLNVTAMKRVCEIIRFDEGNTIVFFDPTSPFKSKRVIESKCLDIIDYIKPNQHELMEMTGMSDVKSAIEALLEMNENMKVIATKGLDGLVFGFRDHETKEIVFREYASEYQTDDGKEIVSTTGTGDSLFATFMWAKMRDMSDEKALKMGLEAAKLSLFSENAINENLNAENLEQSCS